jgi:hypothetical protein
LAAFKIGFYAAAGTGILALAATAGIRSMTGGEATPDTFAILLGALRGP